MKRIFFSLLILLMAMAGMQARTFVLVTGVSNYGDEANNLAQTTKDAKNFAKVMSTQTKDITLLTSSNVTYANVLEKLRAICNRARPATVWCSSIPGTGCRGQSAPTTVRFRMTTC